MKLKVIYKTECDGKQKDLIITNFCRNQVSVQIGKALDEFSECLRKNDEPFNGCFRPQEAFGRLMLKDGKTLKRVKQFNAYGIKSGDTIYIG